MNTLYELTEEFKAAEEAMMASDFDEVTIRDTLEGISMAVEDKIEGCIKWLKNNEMLAEAVKKEEQAMKARRQALENRNARLKEYVLGAMTVIGKDRIEYSSFRVSVRNNAPAVMIDDESLIPERFLVTKKEVIKTDIAKAIKSGQTVPGASLRASRSLSIK